MKKEKAVTFTFTLEKHSFIWWLLVGWWWRPLLLLFLKILGLFLTHTEIRIVRQK